MKTKLNLIETEPNQMWKNWKGNGKWNGSILFVLCIRLISFQSMRIINIETKYNTNNIYLCRYQIRDRFSVLGARCSVHEIILLNFVLWLGDSWTYARFNHLWKTCSAWCSKPLWDYWSSFRSNKSIAFPIAFILFGFMFSTIAGTHFSDTDCRWLGTFFGTNNSKQLIMWIEFNLAKKSICHVLKEIENWLFENMQISDVTRKTIWSLKNILWSNSYETKDNNINIYIKKKKRVDDDSQFKSKHFRKIDNGKRVNWSIKIYDKTQFHHVQNFVRRGQ